MVLILHVIQYLGEEVTVDKNGQSVVRSRSWEGNGRNQTAGFVLNLPIKSNMRNFRIKIEREQVLSGIDGKQSMTTDLFSPNHIEKLLTGGQH